jgi:hypothetical protein
MNSLLIARNVFGIKVPPALIPIFLNYVLEFLRERESTVIKAVDLSLKRLRLF